MSASNGPAPRALPAWERAGPRCVYLACRRWRTGLWPRETPRRDPRPCDRGQARPR